MRASCTIVAGSFSGGEIEPGTFHARTLPVAAPVVSRYRPGASRASHTIPQMRSASISGSANSAAPQTVAPIKRR